MSLYSVGYSHKKNVSGLFYAVYILCDEPFLRKVIDWGFVSSILLNIYEQKLNSLDNCSVYI
jgi:hypothetical protein